MLKETAGKYTHVAKTSQRRGDHVSRGYPWSSHATSLLSPAVCAFSFRSAFTKGTNTPQNDEQPKQPLTNRKPTLVT